MIGEKIMYENIKQLEEYLKSNKEGNNPIHNKLLENGTDYLINSYLKMLAVILQIEQKVSEEQLVMYLKIVLGIHTENSVKDYLRMALEMEIEDYNNFIEDMRYSPLGYRFLLDAFVMISASETQKKQMQFIAELMQSLEIEEKESKKLIMLARSITELNEELFWHSSELEPDCITSLVYYDYIKIIHRSKIVSNDNMIVICSMDKESITVEEVEKQCCHSVPLVKMIGINLELNGKELFFRNAEKIVIDSCTFIGGRSSSFQFEKCKNITITNTNFKNFSNRTLQLEMISGIVNIQNCKFIDCRLLAFKRKLKELIAGVIYSYHPKSIKEVSIQDTIFTNCGILCQGFNLDEDEEDMEFIRLKQFDKQEIRLLNDEFGIGFIANIVCDVVDCQFNNCKIEDKNEAKVFSFQYQDYEYTEDDYWYDVFYQLFNTGSTMESCTLNDTDFQYYVC